jgi:hypothetical protein
LGAAPSSPETSDGGVSAADRDWVADAVRLIERYVGADQKW